MGFLSGLGFRVRFGFLRGLGFRVRLGFLSGLGLFFGILIKRSSFVEIFVNFFHEVADQLTIGTIFVLFLFNFVTGLGFFLFRISVFLGEFESTLGKDFFYGVLF